MFEWTNTSGKFWGLKKKFVGAAASTTAVKVVVVNKRQLCGQYFDGIELKIDSK